MRTTIIALMTVAVPIAAAAQPKTTFTNADLNRKPVQIKPVQESELVWLRANQFVPAEEKEGTGEQPVIGPIVGVFGHPDKGKETTPWYAYTFHGALINNGLTFFPLLMPTLPVSATPQPMLPPAAAGVPPIQR